MSKVKYSMDLVLAILRKDQAKRTIPEQDDWLSDLAKRSGWLKRSLELMIQINLADDVREAEDNETQDSVAEYYARREFEDRNEKRTPSGYNSYGEIVELDFN